MHDVTFPPRDTTSQKSRDVCIPCHVHVQHEGIAEVKTLKSQEGWQSEYLRGEEGVNHWAGVV
jgi:hypothetical protein